jgi:hypothetical protein
LLLFPGRRIGGHRERSGHPDIRLRITCPATRIPAAGRDLPQGGKEEKGKQELVGAG